MQCRGSDLPFPRDYFMGLTRYLGLILLPILVWSLGGAWIEGTLRKLATMHACSIYIHIGQKGPD